MGCSRSASSRPYAAKPPHQSDVSLPAPQFNRLLRRKPQPGTASVRLVQHALRSPPFQIPFDGDLRKELPARSALGHSRWVSTHAPGIKIPAPCMMWERTTLSLPPLQPYTALRRCSLSRIRSPIAPQMSWHCPRDMRLSASRYSSLNQSRFFGCLSIHQIRLQNHRVLLVRRAVVASRVKGHNVHAAVGGAERVNTNKMLVAVQAHQLFST